MHAMPYMPWRDIPTITTVLCAHNCQNSLLEEECAVEHMLMVRTNDYALNAINHWLLAPRHGMLEHHMLDSHRSVLATRPI